ncbi:MAG TPA: hypothetical protein VEJ46_11890 [Candidatus Acidoferrum sp.]|nr:hypothetical protein [Candidatus Acidoferrum sp.]
MKPDQRFVKQPKHFWANVRSLSQRLGYTGAGSQIKVFSVPEIVEGLKSLSLSIAHVIDAKDKPTGFGTTLHDYFGHRAKVLNDYVRPRLMNKERAAKEFATLYKKLKPRCPIPMNKQKGEKRAEAYLTAIVNMLVEQAIGDLPCDYDPRVLTTITREGVPVRTLSRRIDGAFPSSINPVAVWEVKEYYNTTTFGSRVADGVYETQLDGMELEELLEHEKIEVKHYLMVDDEFTWWQCGRSYLCRIIDMLHMGYVDEVLFGYEVIEELPGIAKQWVEVERQRPKKAIARTHSVQQT